MAYINKVLLRVKKDCWHSWKDWFFLEQYAKKLWKDNFMRDFTEILREMEKDWNQPAFTLYELPQVYYWNIKK